MAIIKISYYKVRVLWDYHTNNEGKASLKKKEKQAQRIQIPTFY